LAYVAKDFQALALEFFARHLDAIAFICLADDSLLDEE